MSEVQLEKVNGVADGNSPPEENRKDRVFVLTSFDHISAKRQAEKLCAHLKSRQREDSAEFLDNLAFTLGERRSVLPWKAAFHAPSLPRLVEIMSSDSCKFTKEPKARTLAFVFTGQGAQWYAMGRELVNRYPVFQASLTLADAAVKTLGASWSLLGKLITFRVIWVKC